MLKASINIFILIQKYKLTLLSKPKINKVNIFIKDFN